MALILHQNKLDKKGKIYCKKENQIIEPSYTKCMKCNLYEGMLQGNGVICKWNDDDYSMSDGAIAISDPMEEYYRMNQDAFAMADFLKMSVDMSELRDELELADGLEILDKLEAIGEKTVSLAAGDMLISRVIIQRTEDTQKEAAVIVTQCVFEGMEEYAVLKSVKFREKEYIIKGDHRENIIF